MLGWFRCYFADDDIWCHYEVDDEGWVSRQVDLSAADLRPVTAASLAEVLRARDSGGIDAVIAYESRFGVLAEGRHEWRGVPGLETIAAADFEQIWVAARKALEQG